MSQNIQYLYSENATINPIISALSEPYQIKKAKQQTITTFSLDTFDWRLFKAGYLLHYYKPFRGMGQLVLETLEGVQQQAPLAKLPVFSQDIEADNLNQIITPLIEMRALLPLIKIKNKRQQFNILDQEQKTVVRLMIDDGLLVDNNTKLPLVITLQPLRGYQKAFKRAKKQLKKLDGIQKLTTSLSAQAIKILSDSQPLYTSKLNFKLNPEQTIIDSATVIYQHLLATIKANIDGTKQNIDSEYLHDLRVAVRRTRSALTQIKGLFTAEQLETFKTHFAWIGKTTGAVRDLDVYLLAFNDYQQQLPESEQAALLPFKDFLIKQHRKEQRKLRTVLNSAEFKQKITEWEQFLNNKEAMRGENSELLTQDMANQQIWKLYKKVKKQGLAIDQDTPAEALHDLRKTCKKLRYMMEFFQSIYPNEIHLLIKRLKKLLNNLGDFQDFEVQVQQLKIFSEQMLKENKVKAATYISIGILVKQLIDKQHQAREDFQTIFNTFSTKTIDQQFKQIFKS